MPRVDFRVATAGVKPDTKVLLTSQGSDIGSASGDLFNQGGVLKFHNGSASKTIFFTDTSLAASQLPAFTGDATSSAGSSALTLATVYSGSASVGSSTAIPVITIDAKGRITATSTAAVVAPAGTLSGTALNSTVVTSSLTSVGTLTSLTISGDLAVNGSDITTTSTGTATVFNTNALTVNIGGAATAVSIGAATGTTTVNNSLTVQGNLTVNGTTTTVNATTTTFDDIIITLGGDTAPGADDSKDRGIEFRYFDTQARVGFFGYDRSTNKFTFLTAATNTAEVFSGTRGILDVGPVEINGYQIDIPSAPSTNQVLAWNGTKFVPTTSAGQNTFSTIAVSGQSNVDADSGTDTLTFANGSGITITTNATTDTVTITNSGALSVAGTTSQILVNGGTAAATGAVTLSLPSTINVNTTGSAATLTNQRAFSITGAVTTTASVNFDGSAAVTLNTQMANDAVTLGTHTTGQYVSSLTAGTGVSLANNSGTDGISPTVSIGQAVATSSTVQFRQLDLNDGSTNLTSQLTESTTLATVTPTAIETVSATVHRSVKYHVQATQGTNYMITEILAVHNGSTVNYTEYGTTVIGTQPATFDVDISGANIRLMATSASSSSTVYRVYAVAIPV